MRRGGTFPKKLLPVLALLLLAAPLQAEAAAGDYMVVSAEEGVYVRTAPSPDAEIAGSLAQGTIALVREDDGGDWILLYGGYVKREYMDVIQYEEDPEAAEPQEQESDDTEYADSWDEEKGQAVADYAKQFVGLEYVWGGESLETGCDCSGFTRAIYAEFGVDLPHYDLYQRNYGMEVASAADAKPGDLIFYEDHVTIYIGNGQVVNCSNEERDTLICPVAYRAVEMVRRIFY